MKREYILRGLTCANCADKIENEVNRLDGVRFASVSVITSSLVLTPRDGCASDFTGKIRDIVHRHEPDVVVVDKAAEDYLGNPGRSLVRVNGPDNRRIKIIQLAAGALLFALGFAAERFLDGYNNVSAGLLIMSYVVLGGEIIIRALRNIARGRVFDENFLMSAATIGAFAIGELSEAVTVMLFYQIGEYFQQAATRKSRNSIADLMDIRPDYANVRRNGEIIRVAPDTVDIGEHIIIKPGERIPLDGVIIEGEGMLDTKSLTGESLPRSAKPGDTALSGCISLNGLLTVEVAKVFGESTVAKIIDLVENASGKKARTESFITKFSRYYTPAVVIIAVLLAVAAPLITGGGWNEWIKRGLVFLVISCPCALVISVPLGFFGGIGSASRKGILIKGGNYLEALNDLDIVVFDKTGTLTKGVFEVTGIHAADGFTRELVLELAAYAESFSNHPIALSVIKAFEGQVDKDLLFEYAEIAGHGISVRLRNKDNVTDDSVRILAGNGGLMVSEGVVYTEPADIGTKVYVAAGGVYAGCVVISDEIKPGVREVVSGLRARGVRKTVMLTGDDESIAGKVAGEASIDEVHARLLPHEKVGKLETLDAGKRPNGKLAFVGDGINDAPVLARADIGIAMGGLGSDAAIEAADVVLMTDEPAGLVTALDIAKSTRRIVWQNIVFALGVKGVVMLLGAMGIATMWAAVFADVGVALLAVLNATRIIWPCAKRREGAARRADSFRP